MTERKETWSRLLVAPYRMWGQDHMMLMYLQKPGLKQVCIKILQNTVNVLKI